MRLKETFFFWKAPVLGKSIEQKNDLHIFRDTDFDCCIYDAADCAGSTAQSGMMSRFSGPPRRLGQLILMIFILAFPFKGEAATSSQSVIRDLQSKISTLRSLQGNLTLSASFTKPNKKTETFQGSGKLYTEIPNHFRLDLKAYVKDPDRESPIKFSAQVTLDGKTLWLDVKNSLGKTSFLSFFDFVKLKDEFPEIFSTRGVEGYFNPADELSELDVNKIKILGTTSFSGVPVVVLEGRLKRPLPISFLSVGPNQSVMPTKVRIWVGKEDGVTYQVLMFNAKGKQTGFVRLSNLHRNETLDSSIFEYTPPGGITPVDMTPMLEEELHGKGHVNPNTPKNP